MPVVGSVRIVVAIFSYDGGLYFGVTGDYDGASDIEVLTRGISRGMEDMLALADPPAKKDKKSKAAAKGASGKRAAARSSGGRAAARSSGGQAAARSSGGQAAARASS